MQLRQREVLPLHCACSSQKLVLNGEPLGNIGEKTDASGIKCISISQYIVQFMLLLLYTDAVQCTELLRNLLTRLEDLPQDIVVNAKPANSLNPD